MRARVQEAIRQHLLKKGLSSQTPGIFSELLRAIDRDTTGLAWWRFCEEAPASVLSTVDATLLTALFEGSRSLSARILARPEEALFLPEAYGPERSLKDYLNLFGEPPRNEKELLRSLRRLRHRAYYRIALRDLLGLADVPSLTRELSFVAQASLSYALRAISSLLDQELGVPLLRSQKRCGFVVLGMGKLGGEELNFSSDIDLIYAYESDEGEAGSVSLHSYFTRLAERLSSALSTVTEDGFVFRVDLRLRPEGSRGALVNSLASLQAYYETFGRTWERAALLKARPVAGDLDLGARILDSLDPCIYKRSLDLRQLEEIRSINQAIKQWLSERGGPTFDVKLGRGGIREVELFVQALQLIYAGKETQLREKNTLKALTKLLYGGRISAKEHSGLSSAYLFFRKVEHRLQLWEEQQTHSLPASEEDLSLFARRLGYPDQDAFLQELSSHQQRVIQIFDTLFSSEAPLYPSGALSLSASETTQAERIEAFASLGFQSPNEAEELYASIEPQASVELGPWVPFFLSELSQSPAPDRAFGFFAAFLQRPQGAYYLRFFAKTSQLARLVCTLFGTSDLLSDLLVQQPDIIEAVARRDTSNQPYTGQTPLREIQQEEIFRIALCDLEGSLDLLGVQQALSSLAEDIFRECLRRSVEEDLVQHPNEEAPTLTVVALGKLGGRELSYQSDLDLLFVSDGDPQTRERCTQIAQRTIQRLSEGVGAGPLYEVDTRLRPAGSQGPLVTSLDALSRYYGLTEGIGQRAQLWEEQALLRARPIAGDPELSKRVQMLCSQITLKKRNTPQVFEEVRKMRKRLQDELPKRGGFHLKASRGGLLDIEFLVQALQLAHSAKHPEIQSQNTRLALLALAEAGLLSKHDAQTLLASYLFLSRVSSRARLCASRYADDLPADTEKWRPLSRSLGYSSIEQFSQELQLLREKVRACFDRSLPSPSSP